MTDPDRPAELAKILADYRRHSDDLHRSMRALNRVMMIAGVIAALVVVAILMTEALVTML